MVHMSSAKNTIDVNCDLGESYGQTVIGNDAEIFPFITSCNIACGFHGGDPVYMEQTVNAALEYGVQIGAHPSYPDRENFGRRKMDIPPIELKAVLRYQLAALTGVTRALGGRVSYVKPHGALYHAAADHLLEAQILTESIQAMDTDLAIMGPPGSVLAQVAKTIGVRFIAEAFADRRYHDNGRLVSREADRAVIDDPVEAAKQVLSIIRQKQVTSIEGTLVPVVAQSICVHGDHKNTVAVLRAIDEVLRLHGIEKRAFG
jgi:UPF0271 protein